MCVESTTFWVGGLIRKMVASESSCFSSNSPDRAQSKMCVEEPFPMIYIAKIAIKFGAISEQYGINPLRDHFFSIDANSTLPNKW